MAENLTAKEKRCSLEVVAVNADHQWQLQEIFPRYSLQNLNITASLKKKITWSFIKSFYKSSNITSLKKKKYMKFYKILLRVFIVWYRCMIASLSMLSNTLLSMYVTKQSFIHWSPIRLRSRFFIYFIAKKLLSTIAVATGRVKTNFTSK